MTTLLQGLAPLTQFAVGCAATILIGSVLAWAFDVLARWTHARATR